MNRKATAAKELPIKDVFPATLSVDRTFYHFAKTLLPSIKEVAKRNPYSNLDCIKVDRIDDKLRYTFSNGHFLIQATGSDNPEMPSNFFIKVHQLAKLPPIQILELVRDKYIAMGFFLEPVLPISIDYPDIEKILSQKSQDIEKVSTIALNPVYMKVFTDTATAISGIKKMSLQMEFRGELGPVFCSCLTENRDKTKTEIVSGVIMPCRF